MKSQLRNRQSKINRNHKNRELTLRGSLRVLYSRAKTVNNVNNTNMKTKSRHFNKSIMHLLSCIYSRLKGFASTSPFSFKLQYELILQRSFQHDATGGFNQPIMCGGEPRAMLRKDRGKADGPIYTIQICIPKHGRPRCENLMFL